MRGYHPTFHELLFELTEKIDGIDQHKAYKIVKEALYDWRLTEGIQYKRKPGRPSNLHKKTRIKTKVFNTVKKFYQEKGICPTIHEIIDRLDEPTSEESLRRYCGTMKDIADVVGIPYPENRTDAKRLKELYAGNNPASVLLKDLCQAALKHPDIHYIMDLIKSDYTKYNETTYRKYIGNAQQIADALYQRYGLKIQGNKPPGRKAA